MAAALGTALAATLVSRAALAGEDNRHVVRQVRLGRLDPGAPMPAESPARRREEPLEMKSAAVESHFIRTFTEEAGVVTVTDDGGAPSTLIYSDPAGGMPRCAG